MNLTELAARLGEALHRLGAQVTTAESCTGGGIAEASGIRALNASSSANLAAWFSGVKSAHGATVSSSSNSVGIFVVMKGDTWAPKSRKALLNFSSATRLSSASATASSASTTSSSSTLTVIVCASCPGWNVSSAFV